MKRFLVPAVTFSCLTLVALLVGLNALSVSAGDGASAETEIWAESVVSFQAGAGTIGVNFSDPVNALGPVDAGIVALGNAQTPSAPPANPATCEAVLIVDFGRYQVLDGEGDDLTIYESASGGLREPVWVYIGGETTGWRYVGESTGGHDSVDISHVAGPAESFGQVALCDIPDGNTTVWPAPGPDIDAIAAIHSERVGLVAQAQGPGWSVDLDPVPESRSADLFTPMPEFQDIGFQAPAIFRFECPADAEVTDCNAYMIVKAHCPGRFTTDPPAWIIYPFLFPTLTDIVEHPALREMQGGYVEERFEEIYAFCYEEPERSAANGPEPATVYALEEGGVRIEVVEEAWRFELRTSTATVHSTSTNHFSTIHYPDSEDTIIRAIEGSIEVEPTAAGEDPFTLSAGQQVIVTTVGPQPVLDIEQLFLPVAVR